MWVTGAAFLLAHGLLIAALVLRTRRDLPRRTELFWTILTGVVFTALALTGSRLWAKRPASDRNKETVEVYAHQFAWNFRYPGPDGRFGHTETHFINDSGGNPLGIDPSDSSGRDDLTTATLRIPSGRDVVLLLHARDVIHDFFVPELRTKQDVVPGMETALELRVDRAGQYEIACAELCGLGHSQMRALLNVMPPDEYDRWKVRAAQQ